MGPSSESSVMPSPGTENQPQPINQPLPLVKRARKKTGKRCWSDTFVDDYYKCSKRTRS
jgi:hypothetical protein